MKDNLCEIKRAFEARGRLGKIPLSNDSLARCDGNAQSM